VDGKTSMLNIYDTAGQEDFSFVRDQYIRMGEAFLCMYSVTSEATFEHVKVLYHRLMDLTDKESPFVVLVGNKADLASDRIVTTAQGKALAEKYGWTFMESSAKHKLNVVEAFEELVRMIRREEAKRAVLKWEEETEERVEIKKEKKKLKKRRCTIL